MTTRTMTASETQPWVSSTQGTPKKRTVVDSQPVMVEIASSSSIATSIAVPAGLRPR